MATFSRTQRATRTGHKGGIVVEGVDALVKEFTRKAATVGPMAALETVRYAGKAAERMRDRVPIDEGDLLDSVTSDSTPSKDGTAYYADAGPDPAANPGAFKAHFHENGTVHHAPTPFAGPSADLTLPEFAAAIGKLADLD